MILFSIKFCISQLHLHLGYAQLTSSPGYASSLRLFGNSQTAFLAHLPWRREETTLRLNRNRALVLDSPRTKNIRILRSYNPVCIRRSLFLSLTYLGCSIKNVSQDSKCTGMIMGMLPFPDKYHTPVDYRLSCHSISPNTGIRSYSLRLSRLDQLVELVELVENCAVIKHSDAM